MEFEPGRQVGRYTLGALLGQGGAATVMAATRDDGLEVAIKFLRRVRTHSAERLEREGRVLRELDHPNLVRVHELLEVDGLPALVMERVHDGSTLRELIRSWSPNLWQVDALARGMLAGVAAAHEGGLVHRDLKPSNVLLELGGLEGVRPRLADFGVAKLLAGRPDGAPSTRSGATLGTPAYMAPEQIGASKHVDARADVFSAGCVLYELCTGQRAFPQKLLVDLIQASRRGRFVPLRRRRPSLPTRMVDAITAALDPDPDRRPAHGAALRDRWEQARSLPPDVWEPAHVLALGDALGQQVQPTVAPEQPLSPPDPVSPRLRSAPGRGQVVAAALGGVVVAMPAGGLVGWLLRSWL